uniref:Palmdelphin n=1 Tax=Amphilophus citrinellus TaxID=61819 RepID=A0A3Q0SVL9_AMPCI
MFELPSQDKRRIQEEISKKRRQIEEEKLKLQYIKKKALREQWLMDGLSQQSKEEQEAMRLQAHDEQQQSDQLQSNITRIEKEIEALEAQELSISANEEVVLKRLKEVERTAEDIIRVSTNQFPLIALLDLILISTFAMKISVEYDKKTGKSQVVSTTTIIPETIEKTGIKVYDDQHKSVYALNPDRTKIHNGAGGELTPTELEELLHQATEEKVPSEVHYHLPVYSVPYTGTPRTPTTSLTQTPTPSPSSLQGIISSRNGFQTLNEKKHCSKGLQEHKSPNKTHSSNHIHQNSTTKVQQTGEKTKLHIPDESLSDKSLIPQSQFWSKTQRRFTNSKTDTSSPNGAAFVSIQFRPEGMLAPIQPVYRPLDRCSPSLATYKSDPDVLIDSSGDFNKDCSSCAENNATLNLDSTLAVKSKPVTMIFIGYDNAEDKEQEDIQAELVIIGNSFDNDDNDDEENKNESKREEHLSYHPQGYISKVFQPNVGIAKVVGCRDISEDTYTDWKDSGFHKPTFTYKPGKYSSYLHRQGVD